MKYQLIGATKIKVSRLSLGTWSLGGATKKNTSYGYISKKRSLNILDKAFDMGINLFDTSPTYGDSQKLIGQCFKRNREKIIICSKIGVEKKTFKKDFSKKTLDNQLKHILKSINSDYIDILYLYNPEINNNEYLKGYEFLYSLREKGIIRNFGISLKSPSDLFFFEKKISIPLIQCNFNLLDLRLLETNLLSIIKSKNIGVIARTILNFGFFTESFIKEKKIFKKYDHRKLWKKDQIDKWKDGVHLIKKCSKDKIENIAIKFINSFNFISSSLIGVQNIQELKKNLAENNLKKLNNSQLSQIKDINKKNYFISGVRPNNLI